MINYIEEKDIVDSVAPNSVIRGDCLNVMKYIPDHSVDFILTDLPYGKVTRCKWDTAIPFKPLWKEYYRVIKRGGGDSFVWTRTIRKQYENE